MMFMIVASDSENSNAPISRSNIVMSVVIFEMVKDLYIAHINCNSLLFLFSTSPELE